MYAHRNLKICSTDCLCLFVCPTGATNNETGQIDKDICIGCGACASACPAHAITLLPRKMPPERKKEGSVVNALKKVIKSKIKELAILRNLIELEEDKSKKKLYQAIYHSNKVILEDLYRESGYMTLESQKSQEFLTEIAQENSNKKDRINQLLEKSNE